MPQPVRLYAKGVFLGYRRANTNHTPHTALVKVENVSTREETSFYEGKRVAYVYRVQRPRTKGPNGDTSKVRTIWGRITRPHGNGGVVRAKFAKNLPANAMGAKLRVMMYPSRI
eukprot:GFYU01000159.1.p2 GENE.GFYU01000159.1~~GFYU01000159.1.p2  ORF type:complete len:121 (+),score=20.50 GFYU01000159.1:22-363(+)